MREIVQCACGICRDDCEYHRPEFTGHDIGIQSVGGDDPYECRLHYYGNLESAQPTAGCYYMLPVGAEIKYREDGLSCFAIVSDPNCPVGAVYITF